MFIYSFNQGLKIDQTALTELGEICSRLASRKFSDVELQEIGERIVRFLLNTRNS
jgi:hypothetical protein